MPASRKRWGWQVRHFDADRWNAAARDIVYRGNRAKFLAYLKLLEQLLATKGTTIVEASPDDSIWGIGLAEDDPGRVWIAPNGKAPIGWAKCSRGYATTSSRNEAAVNLPLGHSLEGEAL